MGIGSPIARLFVRLGADTKEFETGAARVRSETQQLRGGFAGLALDSEKLTQALGLVGLGGGLIFTAKQAAGAVWQLGEMGARAKQVERNLYAFAGGAEAAADATEAVRAAANYGLSDLNAEAAALKFLQMQLADNTDQMALYVEGAARLGTQTIPVAARVDEMTQLLKNQNANMLDNFGLSRQLVNATIDRLQATQGLAREEAFLIAVQEEIRRQLDVLGDQTEEGAANFDKMSAEIENAKMALADVLAPAISDVAGAVADITPDLLEAVKNLSILANAGIEWAAAAIQGKDAQVAFNAAVLEGTGGAEEAAQAAFMVAEAELQAARAARDAADARVAAELSAENLSAAEYEMARAAQQAAMEDVRAALEAYSLASAQYEAAGGTEAAAAALEGAAEAAGQYEGRLHRTLAAYMAMSDETKKWYALRSQEALLSQDPYEDQEGALEALGKMQRENAGKRAEAEIMAARQASSAWGSFHDEQQQAYSDLRSTVQQALKATQVTALDFGLSDAGQYVDKWDENARRLDAIAQRGFAELQQHADWASVLKIPPEVLAAGEEALRGWAANTANAVRDLARPDLLNIDAAVQAVEQELNRQAGIELSLDLVTQAALDKGLVTGKGAKSQVAQALGLGQEPIKVPIQLDLSAGGGAGDQGAGGASLATGLAASLEQQAAEIGWTATITAIWAKDFKNNEQMIIEAGRQIGKPLWDGLLSMVRGSGIVNHIIAEVLAALASELES